MRKIIQRNRKASRINMMAPEMAVIRKTFFFVFEPLKLSNNDLPFVWIMCSMFFHVSDTSVYNPTISNKLPSISRNTNKKKLCFNIFWCEFDACAFSIKKYLNFILYFNLKMTKNIFLSLSFSDTAPYMYDLKKKFN